MTDSKRAVILDLDGTLYSWVDYYGPSFRAMVHALNKILDISEEKLIQSFKKVYEKHNSVEYAFSVQELDIWNELNWSEEQIRDIAIKAARGAFRIARKKNLKLFKGVRETLEWLKYEDIFIFAFTDAPSFQAEMRLKALRIDKYFSGMICLQLDHIPDLIPTDVEEKITEVYYRSKIPYKSEINHSDLKPNSEPLIRLINKEGLEKKRTYLIGDSLEKDIILAKEIGIIDIWAEYGKKAYSKKNLETIIKITPWKKEDVKKSVGISNDIEPSYTINEFSEIKNIIGSVKFVQLELT